MTTIRVVSSDRHISVLEYNDHGAFITLFRGHKELLRQVYIAARDCCLNILLTSKEYGPVHFHLRISKHNKLLQITCISAVTGDTIDCTKEVLSLLI